MPANTADRITQILNEGTRLGDVGSALLKAVGSTHAGRPASQWVSFGDALSAIKADRINRASSLADTLVKARELEEKEGPEYMTVQPGTTVLQKTPTGVEEVYRAPTKETGERLSASEEKLRLLEKYGVAVTPDVAMRALGAAPPSEGSMLTTAAKNAIAMGLKPGTPEYAKYIRDVTMKPLMSAGLPAAYAKEVIDLSSQADTLKDDVSSMEMFRQIVDRTETGWLEPITLPVRQALKDVGFNISGERISFQEIFKAQASLMALKFRNPDSGFGLTGNTSNRDLDFLQTIPPSLGNRPESNRAILTILMAKQRRKAQLASAKSEYIQLTGGVQGWGSERDRIVETTDMFTPEDKQYITGLIESLGLASETPEGGEPSIEELLRLYGGGE